MLEELARLAASAACFGSRPSPLIINHFGTETQKLYPLMMARAELLAFALGPHAGSDAAIRCTRAELRGDKYILRAKTGSPTAVL